MLRQRRQQGGAHPAHGLRIAAAATRWVEASRQRRGSRAAHWRLSAATALRSQMWRGRHSSSQHCSSPVLLSARHVVVRERRRRGRDCVAARARSSRPRSRVCDASDSHARLSYAPLGLIGAARAAPMTHRKVSLARLGSESQRTPRPLSTCLIGHPHLRLCTASAGHSGPLSALPRYLFLSRRRRSTPVRS